MAIGTQIGLAIGGNVPPAELGRKVTRFRPTAPTPPRECSGAGVGQVAA